MGHSPVLKLLARRADLLIFLADGDAVRSGLDVEFTNGAHYLSKSYIPAGQAWVDRESPGSGEWRRWAWRQVSEVDLLRSGADPDQAFYAARAREEALRRGFPLRAGPMRSRWIAPGVRLVDGCWVRDWLFVDFTLGGHHLRYPFIPPGEVWIDDACWPAEVGLVLGHERRERSLMERGMAYDAAHALASAAERRRRQKLGRERWGTLPAP